MDMLTSSSSYRIVMKDISLTVPIMLGSKVAPDDDVDATAGAPFSVTGAPFAKGDP